MASTTAPSSSPAVPEDLLLKFFRAAARDLEESNIQGPFTLADIRQLLLTNQLFCLEQVLVDSNDSAFATYTSAQVQDALKHLNATALQAETVSAMEDMNEAARLAFGRLVLHSECLRGGVGSEHATPRHLEANDPIPRSIWLEFCGLCSAACRLPAVQQFVWNGKALFPDTTTTTFSLPIQPTKDLPLFRLDVIQRLFFKALGFDAVHGMAELQRCFFSNDSTFADDDELMGIFQGAVTRMNALLQQQSSNLTVNSIFMTDHDLGGVTRVVAVQYSEQIIDQHTGQQEQPNSTTGRAVSRQTMEQQTAVQQQEQLQVARQAAALQQEILGELFAMPEPDRAAKLQQAANASADFMAAAVEIPAGPERIDFLRGVDPVTQRLMVMHKLWQGMLDKHGGEPPKMHATK